MTARRLLPIRITHDAYRTLKRMADAETNGNVSEMARTLLTEATTARTRKTTR